MVLTKIHLYRLLVLLLTIFVLFGIVTIVQFGLNSEYVHGTIVEILPSRLSKVNIKYYTVNSTRRKRCYKHTFNDTLLVMNFNYPVYDSMDLLHQLYDDVFGKVLSCGPLKPGDNTTGPDIPYTEENTWFYRYRCLTKAILMYPGYKGYLYSNDDVILNWWNLLQFNRNNVWQSSQHLDFRQPAYGEVINKAWMWWTYPEGIEACQNYHKYLSKLAQSQQNYKNLLEIFLKNGNGEARCGKGWTDVFYIPERHSSNFASLSEIAYKSKLMSEIAAHNIMQTLDLNHNIEYINATYLPDLGIWENTFESFWKIYSTEFTAIHPIKLNSEKDGKLMQQVVKNWILNYKKLLFSFDNCT